MTDSAVQGSPEKKREKIFTWQWRNSKEKERLKENGGAKWRWAEVMWEVKTGSLLTNDI